MKPLALLAALCAMGAARLPAQQMQVDQCNAAYAHVLDILQPRPGTGIRDTFHEVDEAGWCVLSTKQQGLDGADFANLYWRADGIDAFIADRTPPLSLSLRIDGLRLGGEADQTELSLVVRQLPETRQLLIEELHYGSDQSDWVHATAIFDRVDLSSWSMTQVSTGSALLSRLHLRVDVGPWFNKGVLANMNADVTGDPQALRDGARELFEYLPGTMLAPGAEDHIIAFIEDFPSPQGELELSLDADPGLGLLQFLIFGQSLYAALDDTSGDPLRGITVDVIWAPE